GTIAVNITSGEAPFRVRLDSGAFINVTGSTHTFSGLGANTYVVEVVDNKGCTDTVNTTILPQVTVTATSTPEDCNLGTITSVGAGGTGTGYVYAVVADGVTPVAGDFAAGNASVDRAAGT
ncbi:hypothetical protein, partial [uncultured Tenacibaculum sp.]|uniref:hypothetical protein n=1 Tax=uncultured Tenacibaculum sp. TaxID=174713 RepID=UPI0026198B12